MSEHRVTITRRGVAVTKWEPGDSDGIHERLGVTKDEFPDEWPVLLAQCSCGLTFEGADAAFNHLDAVAAGEFDTTAGDDESEDAALDAGDADHVALVDMFDGPEFGTGSGPVSRVLQIEPQNELWSLWTAWQLLTLVRNGMMDAEVEYDAVVYRASPDDTLVGKDGRLSPGTTVLRLPEMGVIADWVPAGRPVRVTNAERAPYIIQDAPSDASAFGNQR
ncbi:hypothetical protein [Halorarum salinum]|uniref:Uncharacterized protein n=1 Tax=Halorarum salinum TaxID=2743089 RepID=A0A7D5QG96_9EURY|nr:hypothetical protein [Halobaculum salinum]QLG62063.1 hypothetical protein HUG12_10120 [Halobaculum salinum]